MAGVPGGPAAPTAQVRPAHIALVVGQSVSTTHRNLVHRGVNRFTCMDRRTVRVAFRCERVVLGGRELVKKKSLTPIPKRNGCDIIHSIADHHARLEYSEILRDETGDTCASTNAGNTSAKPSTELAPRPICR